MRSLLIAGVIAGLAATASAAPTPCPTGLRSATTAELYFHQDTGQNLAEALTDWRAFLNEEVAPRFANALPASQVYGSEGRAPSAFIRQPDKALFLVLSGTSDERRNIDLIRDAYQRRFHRDSTLSFEPKACVAF